MPDVTDELQHQHLLRELDRGPLHFFAETQHLVIRKGASSFMSPKKYGVPLRGSGDDSTTGSSANYDAPMPILQPGSTAPAFALQSGLDQQVSLADFRGRNVVLVFYPFDWSPVCGDQLALYNELLEEFESLQAQVLAISVDSMWCHAAFTRDRKYRFPLLADFEPKGQVARAYGAYEAHEGAAERALFVIDGSGVIRWSYLSPMDVNPGADGILKALESLA